MSEIFFIESRARILKARMTSPSSYANQGIDTKVKNETIANVNMANVANMAIAGVSSTSLAIVPVQLASATAPVNPEKKSPRSVET